MTFHEYPDRRHTDPLIKELIKEVQGFREDMKPIRSFMEEVGAAKKAAIWLVGIFAAIGAAITWILNVKDHLHNGHG
jgi:hypothetical protein